MKSDSDLDLNLLNKLQSGFHDGAVYQISIKTKYQFWKKYIFTHVGRQEIQND